MKLTKIIRILPKKNLLSHIESSREINYRDKIGNILIEKWRQQEVDVTFNKIKNNTNR